jgi:Tol biopolymer transport system component
MLCSRYRLISRTLLFVGVFVALVSTAHATFPGKNGRIAFVQGPDIFTMNPDGSDVRQLTTFPDDNGAFWENWSADGKLLVFSRFPAPDFFGQLWLMNADGGNQHLLLNDPGFDDEAPSFSPDGSNVIFMRCALLGGEFPCAIYRVNVDGTGLTAVTHVHIERADLFPVYSPDGSTIAFDSRGRQGILGAIYLMNADGTNPRQLTPAVIGGFLPDWSPDDAFLAFSNHCCNPPPASILTIRKESKRLLRRTRNEGVYSDVAPSWSPEGDEIVFQRTNFVDGSSGIWVMNVNTARERMVHQIPAGKARMHSPRVVHQMKTFGVAAARVKALGADAATNTKQIEEGGNYPRWGVAQ